MVASKRRRSDAKKESPLTREDGTKAPQKSLLDTNEVSFPRGGASALTALELKEVANEATSDVLFTKDTPSTKSEKSSSTHSQKKRKTKVNPEDLVEKDIIPVENLTFKNLVQGTLVLGQITEITKLGLVISLPDNLVGFVAITNISKQITKLIEELDDSDDEDDDDILKSFPDLTKYFQVGQWLRGIVLESDVPSNRKNQKKRIDLSVESEKVNKPLDKDEDLVSNTTLQVTVTSVEDHGLILDIGKEGVNGFISNKEIISAGFKTEDIIVGSVLFTTIINNKGRTVSVKLTSNKKNITKTVASIDSIIPGNVVDALVTEVVEDGLLTRVFGLVDASVNYSHLSIFKEDEIKHKFSIGSIVKARVLAVLLSGGAKKLYLSIQPHILNLQRTSYDTETSSAPLDAFPIGTILDSVKVEGHDSNYLYANFAGDRYGQVHFSRLEGDSSSLNTTYSNGTNHPARILGYSPVDNLYILTLDSKIIKQKYLRVQDVPVGELVQGEVLKVSAETGLVLKLFDQFQATVSPIHLSDVKLVYPERKFKIGSKVRGRVLSIPKHKNLINITLKKALVNGENIITTIDQVKVGERAVATVVAFNPSGAIVSFFGNVKAFLPKSEISEAFVKKAEDYLKLGQTVTVRILTVDPENRKVSVSCRLSKESSEAQMKDLDDLKTGESIVKGKIVEKTKDSIVIELPGGNLRGIIPDSHLSDANFEENRVLFKKLKVGEELQALVLNRDLRNRVLSLTSKESLISASKQGNFPVSFDDIKVSEVPIYGYIKSITSSGLFVGFGSRLTGLVLPKYASDKPVNDLKSLFHINQSVSARVINVDEENARFLLAIKDDPTNESAVNPVDKSIKKVGDVIKGKVTKAIVTNVKPAHLNVQLADNIHGKIDASQIFASFKDIKDPRNPLDGFNKGDVLDVKVIGFFDTSRHSFSPADSRRSKYDTVELVLQKSKPASLLTINDLSVGEEYTGFINNASNGFFFVTLSPSVKGVISYMDLSNNTELLNDIEELFPVGSAIKVRVQSIDKEKGTVILTARDNEVSSFEDLEIGQKVPARVVKVTDSSILVELGKNITAVSYITDALDDYSDKLSEVYQVNDILPSVVLAVDEHNKKIKVSLRSDKAKEKLITSASELKRGDVVKGFVKNITDKGLFVGISSLVTGYVRVADLSDSFLKDWKKFFKLNQLVVGKVSGVGNGNDNVIFTLKESEVNGELHVMKTFNELEVGDIFEGSIRTVTDFGVFVKLDGTQNVSGLCHRSQISDNAIHELKALFGEGDRVKVKVLSINAEKRQLSLGMKASYFESEEDTEMKDADESIINEDEYSDAEDGENSDEEIEFQNSESEDDGESESDSDSDSGAQSSGLSGLGTNGFDWTAQILDQVQDEESSDEEDFTQVKSKKKKASKKIIEDVTGDIRSKAPQSVSDFERLIVGNPNSSIVWMNYMSFQLQLSEIEKAREIGERALKTINYREEQEKLNIWIALLNLENTFGTSETLEDVFKRSTEYMDSLTMHQKLVSIYILSENFEKADDLFKIITKKFGRSSVAVWVLFGDYLLDRDEQTKAHEVLGNALQVLPKRDHVEVVRKFAQLEFKKGDPEQGRTLFEGLIADVPKRIDICNVYIDQEIKKGEKKKAEELFERVLQRKINRKQAKFFFGKWLSLEESNEDAKGAEYVKAKAQQFVNSQ